MKRTKTTTYTKRTKTSLPKNRLKPLRVVKMTENHIGVIENHYHK